MSVELTIITKDHILAYIRGDLAPAEKELVRRTIANDDRAKEFYTRQVTLIKG